MLEQQRLLERRENEGRIYRLTEQGRLRALGGRDPQIEWSRQWDGCWRLICFDVPTAENVRRRHLREYLRARDFGLLQRSIWITPHPLDAEAQMLGSTDTNVKSLILFQGRACACESNQDIVSSAWDFSHINNLYRRHLAVLNENCRLPSSETRMRPGCSWRGLKQSAFPGRQR